MKYLLDSNAVIAMFKGNSRFLANLRAHHPQDICISSIVVHELFFGAYKSQHKSQNLERVQALQFETLNFDRADAQHAGELRALLAAAGTPIGPYDVLIAGQAMSRGLTLITRNVREFQRATGIAVEDWES
ncbi:type II toxin-antitoxin system VapC family toxin [Cupriavidus respiraculi]|uniref:type II toxin-antitoxin system VapC family toxin n=1 Tax=Cupriavidus respiraculi TaxID=195930 RepID=UPI001C94BABE|nr:type II toxin-antitoxin system VapC family toxin [Cupriavidus respiraculi]MBY4948166.1 type II toxin-antitoxin system VapC family toxin [Cupriavidus respiraculi]